jgi:hypothetical protein
MFPRPHGALPPRSRRARLALASLLTLASAGCALGGAAPGDGPTLAPEGSAPPGPTATPAPVLLLLGASEDTAIGAAAGDWAGLQGWGVTTSAGEAGVPGVQVVVAISPPAGSIEDLAAAAEFGAVVVNPPEAIPGDRISTIGAAVRRDQAGFLAGVLAGLASQTGTVGRIDETGGGYETVYQASFMHGLRYGCPGCGLAAVPVGEASVDFFRANGIDVVWAVPGPEAGAILAALAEGGLWVVWAEQPPAGAAQERLAGGVALRPEAGLAAALDSRVAQEVGRDFPYEIANGSLAIVELQDAALSPGRQRIALEAQAALASGVLDTGIDPLTGEER